MKLPQSGGCQCGAFRYELCAGPSLVYTCHCTECQHATSSAFSMALVIEGDAFTFEGMELRPVSRAADSGRMVTRWICRGCGTWVYNGTRRHSRTSGAFRLRAGTLDDTSWLRPTAHFWLRSKQPWIILPTGDLRFETQPADNLASTGSRADEVIG